MPVKEEEKQIRNLNIDFEGDKFVIPQDMDYNEAIMALTRQRDQEMTYVSAQEKVNAFPLDGAVAFQKALKEKYGWANLVPTHNFFGSNPPAMIGVEIAPNQTIQVPWGACKVPKIDGTLTTGWTNHNDMPIFNLSANVKRMNEKAISELAARVREIVATDSIYRGQAVKINFRDRNGSQKIDFKPSFAPQFMDLNKYNDQKAVYSKITEQMIDMYLFNPVIHSQKCRDNGIPLKRGVVLEGRFGTGKTLTAYGLAKTCVQNGWTFLYVEDVRDISLAMSFAKMYAPCVLFAEDVDRTIPIGSRSGEIDKILNTFDGVESKDIEVITVLTTNNVNGIHPGFLRPGRIDTVIPVHAPDSDAMLRLVRHYAKTKSGDSIIEGTDEQIIAAISGLKGTNAAFVKEAVERSKLCAIEKPEMMISPEDLKKAIVSMGPQIKMVCPNAGEEKDSFDPEKDIMVDPLRLAGEIAIDTVVHAFMNKLLDPRSLQHIIMKGAKAAGGGSQGDSPFSSN